MGLGFEAMTGGSSVVGHEETPRWRNITAYDVPGVAMARALEGDIESVVRSVFNQDSMTVWERVRLAEKYAKGPGILKAAVGIATNPWVWLSFVTSPVGAKALRSGMSLFTQHPAYARTVARSTGLLRWFLSPMEHFGGDIGKTVTQVVSHIAEGVRSTEGSIAAASTALIHKIKSTIEASTGKPVKIAAVPLDYTQYEKGSPMYKALREITTAMAVRALKLDRERKRTVHYVVFGKPKMWMGGYRTASEARKVNPDLVKEYDVGDPGITPSTLEGILRDLAKKSRDSAKSARISGLAQGLKDQELEEFVRKNTLRYSIRPRVESKVVLEKPQFNPGFVEEVWEKWGDELEEYYRATQRASREAFVRALGRESLYRRTGQVQLDPGKLDRLALTLIRKSRTVSSEGQPHELFQGMEGLMAVAGPAIADAMRLGQGITAKQMRAVLRKMLDPVRTKDGSLDEWMSRNTWTVQPVIYEGNRVVPDRALDMMTRQALRTSPMTAIEEMGIGRVTPLTSKELVLHLDDYLENLTRLTPYGRKMALRARKMAVKAWMGSSKPGLPEVPSGRITMGLRPDYVRSFNQYVHSIYTFSAMNTMKMSREAIAQDAAMAALALPEVREFSMPMGVRGNRKVGEAIPRNEHKYVNAVYLIDRMIARMPSPADKALVRNALMPGMVNSAGPEWVAIYNAQIRAKEHVNWFANSWLGRTLEKYGGEGAKQMIKKMREMGDLSNPEVVAPSLADGLAKWFYASHLGLNLSSVVLNLTQPLLLSSAISRPMDIVRAYGEAIEEAWKYAKGRVTLGANPTQYARIKLMRDSFKDYDLLGIGPHVSTALDVHLPSGSGGLMDRTFQFFLKGFEKSEWFNRVVAGKMLRQAYISAGRRPGLDPHWNEDLQRLIWQSQFAAHDLNTPMIFLRTPYLRHPLFRQFLTFPIRSLTGAAWTFPTMGGETAWKGFVNVFLRQMGTSAVINEMGKHLIGTDLSKGLFWESTTDLLPFKEEHRMASLGGTVPLPPVFSVPLDFVRAALSGDGILLTSVIGRMVPGGVAAIRAMGALPPETRSLHPLRTPTAGWSTPDPEGRVPVFSSEGALVGWYRPWEIVFKALGADLSAWKEQGAFDRYITRQREEIRNIKREWLVAQHANDMARADAIRREFERRFKVPFTVSRHTIDGFHRKMEEDRTARILRSVDPLYRVPLTESIAADSWLSLRGRGTETEPPIPETAP